MAGITDFLNASPQMRLSGIDARLGELQREFDQAQMNGDTARATMLNEQINETIKERVNVMGMIGDMQRQADGPRISVPTSMLERFGETERNAINMDERIERMIEAGKGTAMAAGGEASFPDLTGDGKVTQADILKGRGVKFAEGDEVSMMMMEMEEPAGEAEDVMAEVADVAPAAQALDQYVNMVVEMIQAGASEAEVIQMLQEAGLDEADINAVFQAVLEAMQGPSIDSELAALG